VPVDEYVRRSERNLLRYQETRRKLLNGESFPLERSAEYGSVIIHAMVTGEAQLIYGNVENTRLIDNLPEGCCVEVPVVVDRNGLRPCHVGNLPPELAAHCAPHVFVQDLTVRAALEGSRPRVYRAAVLDRHAGSVLVTRRNPRHGRRTHRGARRCHAGRHPPPRANTARAAE